MKNKSINDYKASKPSHPRPILKQIRSIIQFVVPVGEEGINYMIPCYKILPSYSEHLPILNIPDQPSILIPKKPLPVAMIKKIIKLRIIEYEERQP